MRTLIMILMLTIMVIPNLLKSQKLGKYGSFDKSKPFAITGGLHAGSSVYTDNSDTEYSKPLGWNLSARINIKLFGIIDLPLRGMISQSQRSINYPVLPQFKRLGFSPRYRWLQLHAGYRSFRLSPYLTNGTTILGGGISLTPGIFRLEAFYGKSISSFNIPPEYLSQIGNDKLEFYNRKVMGLQMGIAKRSDKFNIYFYKSFDEKNSGSAAILKKQFITPRENFGIALQLSKVLFKVLRVKGNVAASIVTNNTEANKIENEEVIYWTNKAKALTVLNESTRYGIAYDSELSLLLGRSRIAVKYQHIDPHYEAFGVRFIQPDLDNYTLHLNTSLFKSKFNFSGNLGMQFNNTKNYFTTGQKRIIGSVNMIIRPTKKLNLNLNYNNFSSESATSIQEFNDTLALTTNNQGINGSITYKFGAKENQNIVTINASSNVFDIIQQDKLINENKSNNYRISYKKRLKSIGLSLGGQAHYYKYDNITSKSSNRYGLGINARKIFKKHISLSGNMKYSLNYSESNRDGSVINAALRSRLKISKKQTFGIAISMVSRRTTIINPFFRTRFSANYGMNF